MRSAGHIVYLSLIAVTAIGTYQLASPTDDTRADNLADHETNTESVIPAQDRHRPVAPNLTHHLSIDPPPSSDTNNNFDDALQARIEQLEAELLAYQQSFEQLNSIPQYLTEERIEKQRAMGRNYEWAIDTELDLETLFLRDERLRNIYIEQIECFTEHCELTLNHTDLDDGFPTQYFTGLLTSEDRLSARNFMVMSVGNSEETRLTLVQQLPETD